MKQRLTGQALALAAVAAAVIVASTGCARRPDTDLERALLGRHWESALQLAQAWMRREPDNIVAAWLVYRTAHRLPDDHASWPGRDRVTSPLHPDLTPMGDWAKALTQRHRRSAVAWQLRADAATLANEPDEAMRAAQKAVRLAPDDPYSYLARAWAFAISHDNGSAIADAETAIRVDPRCAWAYADLGVLLEGRGQGGRHPVLEAFRTSVRVNPRLTTGHVFLARAYWKAGNAPQAAAGLERASSLGARSFRIYQQLAIIYSTQGMPARALANANKAIACMPEVGEPYMVRAEVYSATSDRPHALADVHHALTLQPQDADLQYGACRLFCQLGEPQEAQAAARAFLAVASPDDPRAPKVREALEGRSGEK